MKEDSKVLIHLTDEYEKNYTTLIPYIPKSPMGGEDQMRKRICTSVAIQDCIKAQSRIWYQAIGYAQWEGMDPYYDMSRKVVLLDHNEEGGFLIKGYECHPSMEQIVTPQVLFENGWVPDALETNEHWILEEIKPHRTFYVLITGGEWKKDVDCKIHFQVFEENEIGTIENMLDYHRRKQNDIQ